MQARQLGNANKRGSKRASDVHMPGVNEMYTTELNKRHKIDVLSGGHPKDTQQNTLTTTVMCLPPPTARGAASQTEKDWYAPASTNSLADTPTRGDWAVTAPDVKSWIAASVSSGMNPNSNAVPVFTNMAKVPKNVRLRFVGCVGNASQNKQGTGHADKFGTVLSGGAYTGSNTGPAYIPPLSKVYGSPFSYVTRDSKTGKPTPGFINPGWNTPGAPLIDKYTLATFALREGDVTAFFIGLKIDLREAAKRDDCIAQKETILSDLRIHPHLPIYLYAKHYLFQARVEHLMSTAEKDHTNAAWRNKVVDAINHTIKENKAYWVAVEKEQLEINNRLGGPQWDTRRAASNELQLLDKKSPSLWMDISLTYPKLLLITTEIYEQQYAEHQTFMSELFMGKSRYGSAPGGGLDLMCGFNINC